MGFSGSLDQDFLRRVQRTTLVLGLVLALCVASFVGARGTAAWLTGVGLSVLNLAAIRFIVQRVLRPDPQVGFRLAIGLLVKVPLLFAVVFGAVKLGLPVLWLALGFSLLFVVFLGKILGVIMLRALGLQVTETPRANRSERGSDAEHGSGTGRPTLRGENPASDEPNADLGAKRRLPKGLAAVIGLFLLFVSPLLPGWHQPDPGSHSWGDHSLAKAQSETPPARNESQSEGAGTDALEGTDAHTTLNPASNPETASGHPQPSPPPADGLLAQHEQGSGHDNHDQAGSADPATPAAATGHGAAADHGAATPDGADHGDDHGGVQHFPNLVTYATALMHDAGVSDSIIRPIHKYENLIFSLIATLILGLLTSRGMRNPQMIPGRLQNVIEYLFGGYYDFVRGVLGSEARRYIPFVGTLFFYIWCMNWMGLVPLGHSPTSDPYTTFPLAVCVFLYVQYIGLTRLGPVKYLSHLAGDPKDVVGWCMVPLMLPLHLIGEVAKPLSLALRLFGNIMGEDTLLALFAGLIVIAIPHVGSFGLPIHLPFMFLALLASTIQALVFSLLATIYISLVLPHEEHAH